MWVCDEKSSVPCADTFFVRQNQVPILVGLQCLTIYAVQWQFGRRCVCMLKRTYHRTYRKWEKDDSVGAGSHADSVHLKPSTENTTKVMLGWSCVFLKGDNMTEAPTRVCGFFGHIWIANALFFFVFFFFSEGWFRKRLWQSRSKQHGEACVSFGMFSQDELF